MIRIGCTQPVSRFQYLLGKSIAIELHVILFAVVYVASLLLWVCICTGFRGLSAPTATAVVSLASRTAVFCVALSGCMIAVSVLRRSLLDALVTCCVVFACLALLTTLPMRFHLEAGLLYDTSSIQSRQFCRRTGLCRFRCSMLPSGSLLWCRSPPPLSFLSPPFCTFSSATYLSNPLVRAMFQQSVTQNPSATFGTFGVS